MIYTTGSVAVSGNTLTGTGTNFTQAGSLIRNGCTVLVMTSPVQVFQITATGNATTLTVSPAANPAIPAGTKFAILLSDSLSVDGLAQDIAETFSMYQRYMGGFADVMNGSGDVTITINGQPVTVPGQKSLAKKGANTDITSLGGLTTALSAQQGGTGAKDASQGWLNLLNGRTPAAARSDLQLGSSALRDAYSNTGAMLSVGDFGLGGKGSIRTWNDTAVVGYLRAGAASEFWRNNADTGHTYAGGCCLYTVSFDSFFNICVGQRGQGVRISSGTTDAVSLQVYTVYTDKNTSKASDGTLKAASPVARIVKSKKDCQRTDIDEEGFSWCGCGTANEEAEGISVSRLDTGVYTLTGSAGLASSGWQLLPPRDPQGSGDMGIVEAEQTESGGLTIRLYKRRYVLTDDGDIEVQKGAAIDVPVNSWIDVRLDMPETSLWNQRAAGTQEQ
ncbi:phage tail protein [Kosakonia sp. 1610]|uniref:phage tail fiber protein n=1 Tax=Kosakonia sp. 1610 TaxID=3156426 RepID=UPI003D1B24CD